MRASSMIVSREVFEVSAQATFVENDNVIEALAADGPNHALNVGALPRRAWRRKHLLNSHPLDLFNELMPENAIAITQQIARHILPRKRLPQLLGSPFRSWMCGNGEVNNTPTLMRQHQKDIEDLKPNRRHGEKVDRHKTAQMIIEEGPPSLGRRLPISHEIFTDTGLANVDSQLEQFAVNAGRAPARIVFAHAANKCANLVWDRWPSWLAS